MITPRCLAPRRAFTRPFAAFAALCLAGLPCAAATFTWSNGSGALNWDVPANWVENVAPPLADPATELVFGGADPAYTATNNIGLSSDVLQSNILRLNSSVTAAVQTLNAFETRSVSLVADGATNPTLVQQGAGGFRIDLPLSLGAPSTFNGAAGSGLVSFLGPVGGTGTLAITGGNWQFGDVGSTWSGATTISGGAAVELKEEGTGNLGIAFAGAGTNGIFGTANTIAINGGSLKLTTQGTGSITLGTNRVLAFGANGGTFSMVNLNPAAPTTHAGQIASGDLAVTLNNTAANPAVIQFNGGQVGLSQIASPFGGDWSTGGNVLRLRSIAGTGPLRLELTHGAMARAGTGAGGTVTVSAPTTVRGVLGGDPTSGPLGTTNSAVSLNTARFVVDGSSIVNYSAGLVFEGAVQATTAGASRAFDGNITIAGTGSGQPGYVSFAGRSTGTNIGSAVQAPGGSAVGQNFLYLGQGGNDTLTIQDGGIAAIDIRFRTDQADNHGVLLNATTAIQAGGKLRFLQSISSASSVGSPAPNATGNVGNHIVQGNIRGEGSTASESVIDLHLPAANVLLADETTANRLPHGGIDFEASSGIVVNGTGFGGLRVNALARPNNLFSGATADPVANTDKLNNYFTAARLAAVTGTGGYLTPAPAGGTFSFPDGGEWSASVPVGLKAVDSNAGGADVSFAAIASASFAHNLDVASDATVDTGSVLFTLGPVTAAAGLGTVSGKGTIAGTGGLLLAPGAILSPGEGDAGILTAAQDLSLSLGTQFVFDLATTATSDLMVTLGTLTLTGQQFSDFTFNPMPGFGAGIYTLFDNVAVSGTLGANLDGTIGGLPAAISVSGTDVVLNVVPEPGAALSLIGGLAVLAGFGRARRRN